MNGRHDRNPRECEIRHHPPKPPSEVSRWREITDDGVAPERLPALAASATAPDSPAGIAFNRNHPDSREVRTPPNHRAVRASGRCRGAA
jgi:hypothetical protein